MNSRRGTTNWNNSNNTIISARKKCQMTFLLLVIFALSSSSRTFAHRSSSSSSSSNWPWQTFKSQRSQQHRRQQQPRQKQQQHLSSSSSWSQKLHRLLYAWQTATPYSDPNNICTAGATGYRATPGCLGYAFCNNGYLMGGGSEEEMKLSVIACGTNQLFDEGIGACTARQNVKCNKPGGGSSSNPNSKPTTARPPTDNSDNIARINNPWDTPNYSPNYSPNNNNNNNNNSSPTTVRPPTTARPPTNNNNGNPATVTNYNPWDTPNYSPNNAPNPPPRRTKRPTRRPVRRPTKEPTRRPTAPRTPRPQTPSASLLVDSAVNPPPPTRRPTPRPNPRPTKRPLVWRDEPEEEDRIDPTTGLVWIEGSTSSSYFCGARWGDWSLESCDRATPCPGGDHSACPAGESCFPRTPCVSLKANTANSQTPKAPTPKPTPVPLLFEGDPSKRFCGYDWAHVVESCLTATPCSGGYSQGVCPDGMICIADAPCSDEAYLAYLRGETSQADDYDFSPIAESKPSPSSSTATAAANVDDNNGIIAGGCATDRDCPMGQFCNRPGSVAGGDYGRCGWCLLNGMGCPADKTCNLNDLACEDSTVVDGGDDAVASLYQNPDGNKFFCGINFTMIRGQCLRSKPCPNGVASVHCSSDEGCFFVPTCKAEYSEVAARQSAAIAAIKPRPTSRPTAKSVAGTVAAKQLDANQEDQATSAQPARKPVTRNPTKQVVENPTSTGMVDPTVPAAPYKLFQTEIEEPSNELQKYPTSTPTVRQPEIANGAPSAPVLAALFPEDTANEDSNKNSAAISGETVNQNRPTPASQTQPTPETCRLCGDATLDRSRRVNLEGSNISCAQVVGFFLSESIKEGSNRCLNFRGQYFSTCCNTEQADDLIDQSASQGSEAVVSGLANQDEPVVSSLTQPAQETMCSLCGESKVDPSRRVNFGDTNMSCGEIGWVFVSESIAEGSDRCLNFRGQYFEECCNASEAGESYNAQGSGTEVSPPTIPSTHGPTRESDMWKTIALLSPAPTIKVSPWSCCFLIAVGISFI